MSGKYALIIANTEYTDPKLAELTAPGKDAEELARVLKSPDIAAFDEVNTLFNENVFNVNQAIEEFFELKKPDDLLVLYFSGHGVRDEYGSLHLAVKNTSRIRLRSTAIRSNFIRESMDHSRSKRQVLILDCCNSGAFAQGTKAETGGSVGTASAFEGTGYGRVVLTASDSTQFAWEGNKVIGETANSLFTHFLVKGLEGEADRDGDGSITVDELYDYAYEQIVSHTPKQTPGKWSYKQQGEIVLRQNIRIEDTRPIPLPDELILAMENPLPSVREGAVRQLETLLGGRNLGLARSARAALEKIAAEDDSRSISRFAADILNRIQEEKVLAKKRAEKNEKGKNERETAEKTTYEKVAKEKDFSEKVAQIEVDHEWGYQKKRKVIPILIVAALIIGLTLFGGFLIGKKLTQEPIFISPATESTIMVHTRTSTATFTRQPSQTPQPSLTSTNEAIVFVNANQAQMYQGPGLEYYKVDQASFQKEEKLTVLAKDTSGFWFLCEGIDGTMGWLYLDWIRFSFDTEIIPTASFIPHAPSTPTRRPKSKPTSEIYTGGW